MSWADRLEQIISQKRPCYTGAKVAKGNVGFQKRPDTAGAKVAKDPLAPLATADSKRFQKNTSTEEAIAEHLTERAAIQEYDGGMTREQAETEAQRALRVFQYRLTDTPKSWLILIAPGCSLDEARNSLRRRFGNRLIEVKEYSNCQL